jgi:hypothetical protein
MPVVEITLFLYAQLQVKIICRSKQQRENEKGRGKSERKCVWLKRVVASLINLTIGQILRSSMTVNPLETKQIIKKIVEINLFDAVGSFGDLF